MSTSRPANRLATTTSPYLLQHAHNPVDWYPWGEEALERARREDRPILLSIGYAACHWCHVMERESFEDEGIAALMNENFVCVKVDREERPDLDDIYMTAVQMMTGRGGWPLTVFLTPELKPFFGGTYFPPDDGMGMPGFRRLLTAIAHSYAEQRDPIESSAGELAEHLRRTARGAASSAGAELDAGLLRSAAERFRRRFEPVFGGFSHAPKFPHPMALSLLLRHALRHGDADILKMVTLTLDRMAYGGIYDQLAGGFHRYATDDRWLVPHFEKMLYDNALLATVYLEAFQLTGHGEYARVATETLDWVARDMQSPQGGYYSTLDADSEGVEGKFYVWSKAEVEELVGSDAALFCTAYGVTEPGNWEGTNILNLSGPAAALAGELGIDGESLEKRLAAARRALLAARERRTPPALDDKVLTDWNGLMIAAMARGYRVLGEHRFLDSARHAASFAREHMLANGRLLHTHRDGRSHLLAYLDDHANLMWGLLELYESTFELEWLSFARRLAEQLETLFRDAPGGFFFTGSDHEPLIARMKPGPDGSTPSGNAVAANALLRLHTLTGEESLGERGAALLRAFQPQMAEAPTAFAHMLAALDYYLREPREIVIAGPRESESVRAALARLWRPFRPHDLIVAVDPCDPDADEAARRVPLLAGKKMVDDRTTFYACRNYACDAPTHDLAEVASG